MSTITAYGAKPDLTDVLVIGVSQSGGSPDLVTSTWAAREAGATTLAVTNDPDSPLAAVAEFHIDVLAGRERALPATKTYTASLLSLYLFVGGPRAAATARRPVSCPTSPTRSWPAGTRCGRWPPATGSPNGWSSSPADTATPRPRRRR